MELDDRQRVFILAIFNNAMYDIEHSLSPTDFKTAWEFFLGTGSGNRRFQELCGWIGKNPASFERRARSLLRPELGVFDTASETERRLSWITLHRQNQALRTRNDQLRTVMDVKKTGKDGLW